MYFNSRIFLMIEILLIMLMVFIIYIHLINRDNILLNLIVFKIQQMYLFIRITILKVKVKILFEKKNLFFFFYLNRETTSKT
jgi:hypothetical protein